MSAVPIVLGPTRRIIEFEGILWEIIFEVDDEVDPVLCSVRTLDADYHPTGPNLMAFLDKCFVITGHEEGGMVLGEMNHLLKREMI